MGCPAGNLLVHEHGAISAVLDWETAAIADPAQDLALARYLGARFTTTAVDAYRSSGGTFDHETQDRADRHWELRELTGRTVAITASTGYWIAHMSESLDFLGLRIQRRRKRRTSKWHVALFLARLPGATRTANSSRLGRAQADAVSSDDVQRLASPGHPPHVLGHVQPGMQVDGRHEAGP
jgi:aminoglycoside phosphotransferase (APT) family kinase protein